MGDGMQIIDAIAALGRMNAGGAFTELPIRNYQNNVAITDEHLVVISDVVVTDATVNSAATLKPQENTLINSSDPNSGSGSSSGGSIGWLLLSLLGLFINRKILEAE